MKNRKKKIKKGNNKIKSNVNFLYQLFTAGHGNSALLALPLILAIVMFVVMVNLPDCGREETKLEKQQRLQKSIDSAEAENKRLKEEIETRKLKIANEANTLFLNAKRDCVAGEYKAAKGKIEKALKLSPERKDLAEMFNNLMDISKIAPAAGDKTKEAELLRRGISYYLEGDVESCLDIFAYILYFQTGNDDLKKWYREKEKSPLGDWNYTPVNPLKDKLMKALGLFYEGKYSDVIEICKEVLKEEPNNILALERMGSAYYKLGQKQNAKITWEKAYKLDPDNKNLKKFIDKIDKEIRGK